MSALQSEAPNPLDALNETSPEAEAVQPEEGQGQPDATETSAVQPEGQGQPDAETGLYDLSTVPEEHRAFVEEHLKNVERNANGKFQEHAEYREGWQPYEELGIQDIDPGGLGALIGFAEKLVDPETGELDPVAARDAIMEFAEGLGVDLAGDGQHEGDLDAGDADDETDDDVPSWARQLMDKDAERERQAAEAAEQEELREITTAAEAAYRKEFEEVESLNGQPFDKTPGSSPDGDPQRSERDFLIGLAKRFQLDNDEPIKAAYQLMQTISGRAEAALVNGQPEQPKPSEGRGRASSPVRAVDTFEDAERIHRERNASR